MLNVVSASSFSIDSENIGAFKQSSNMSLTQSCNCTSVNITAIKAGNGTLYMLNAVMTANGTFFNYTLDKSYLGSLGIYTVYGVGNLDGLSQTFSYTFQVNTAGVEGTTARAVIYIGMLIVLIFLFIVDLAGISMLPKQNPRDDKNKILSISYLKYLRNVLFPLAYLIIMLIVFVSANISFAFLENTMMGNIMFSTFRLMFGGLPLFVMIWLFYIIQTAYLDIALDKALKRGAIVDGKKAR